METEISPLAKRLAEQNNVEWWRLTGTGADGKIVERDVLEYLAKVMSGEEDVNPTPEPVPEGMEAWPEEDVAGYFGSGSGGSGSGGSGSGADAARGSERAAGAPGWSEASFDVADDDLMLETDAAPKARADELDEDIFLLDEDSLDAGSAAEWRAPPSTPADDPADDQVDDRDVFASGFSSEDSEDEWKDDGASSGGRGDVTAVDEPPLFDEGGEDDAPTYAQAEPPVFEVDPLAAPAPDAASLAEMMTEPAPDAASGADLDFGAVAVGTPERPRASRDDLNVALTMGRPAAESALPLVSYGMLLRRYADLGPLFEAQSAILHELGEGSVELSDLLARAAAKALRTAPLGDPDVDAQGAVGMARFSEGEMTVVVPQEAATRALRDVLGAQPQTVAPDDLAGRVGVVVADLSPFDVDEAVLKVGVPVLTMGRILFDSEAGGHRSTLALSGDVGLEQGTRFLAAVAELLRSPLRLVV